MTGIASTVENDTDLASHPSVLIYDNIVSTAYIASNFDGLGTARPNLTYDVSIVTLENGLNAARCETFDKYKAFNDNPDPDWLEIVFSGSKTITGVTVYSIQDNYTAPVEPSDVLTFSLYGIINFDVLGWNGSAWVTLASVINNNLVKRVTTFAAFTTTKIRINVLWGAYEGSYIAEVEAWEGATNVALASNGATVSASTTLSAGYPASAAINGSRTGAPTGAGGYWADNTQGNQRLTAWHHWAEPERVGKPWTRPYGEGHEHLFFRYMFVVGTDVPDNHRELGMKLLGMAGTYDWSSSGAVTYPPPTAFAVWEARLWHPLNETWNPAANYAPGRMVSIDGVFYESILIHSNQLPPNPTYWQVVPGYRLSCYYYGVFNPNGSPANYGRFAGSGDPSGPLKSSGFLIPGTLHCIEQEVQLNSVVDPDWISYDPDHTYTPEEITQLEIDCQENANMDGVMRIWLDGVLVYESLTVGYRGDGRVRIQDLPFGNIYHGGLNIPPGTFHYDVGALCVATEYIGPPNTGPVSVAGPGRAASFTRRRAKPVGGGGPPVGVEGSIEQVYNDSTAPGWYEITPVSFDALRPPSSSASGWSCTFINSMPWDPVNKKIRIVGFAHGDWPSWHLEYDNATNNFYVLGRGYGSHGYQHPFTKPSTGEQYLIVMGNPWAGEHPVGSGIYYNFTGYGVYKYTGLYDIPTEKYGYERIHQVPSEDWSGQIGMAADWWDGPAPGGLSGGAAIIYTGQYGMIYIGNPDTNAWTQYSSMLPGQTGFYHNIGAYSKIHNCFVYGGGNTSNEGELAYSDALSRQVWRMNSDGTKTRMPDAPGRLGVSNGAAMCADPLSGNILYLDTGAFWSLNPTGSGTWTDLTTTFPPPLVDPYLRGIVMSATEFGVVVLVKDVGAWDISMYLFISTPP